MITSIKNNKPDNMLKIEYMLGNTCNQKCNYCFPGSNEGTDPWPDLEVVQEHLSHLLNHYKKNGTEVFNIYFLGGEPTLWDGFLPLCDYLKKNYDCILEISTNGTRGIIWWTKAGRVLDQVNLSAHHEFVQKVKMRNLADYLYELNLLVSVDVLMDPNSFEECEELVEFFKESRNDFPILAKPVLYDGVTKYGEKQAAYLADHLKQTPPEEWFTYVSRRPRTTLTIEKDNGDPIITHDNGYLTANGLNYFKDWNCNIGVEYLRISAGGDIAVNCGQKMFKKHYNLYSTNFKEIFNPKIQPVTCQQDICRCVGEIMVNKWKA